MTVKITTLDGKSVGQGIYDILKRVVDKLNSKSGKIIEEGLKNTVQRHFQTIYPASQHYNPSKVTAAGNIGNVGQIDIDVPGITRAYKDINIFPKSSKRLTIPMHSSAYGKKASDFSDLIYIRKKNGKEFLAQNNGGNITMMYFLAKQVHQPKDSRLMPSDENLADNCFSRIISYLSRTSI